MAKYFRTMSSCITTTRSLPFVFSRLGPPTSPVRSPHFAVAPLLSSRHDRRRLVGSDSGFPKPLKSMTAASAKANKPKTTQNADVSKRSKQKEKDMKKNGTLSLTAMSRCVPIIEFQRLGLFMDGNIELDKLPPLDFDIEPADLNSEQEKKVLSKLMAGLDLYVGSMKTSEGNEAVMSQVVGLIQSAVVCLFNKIEIGYLNLEVMLHGQKIHEKKSYGEKRNRLVDYSIHAHGLNKFGVKEIPCIMGVTEVKTDDFVLAVAQNTLQMRATITEATPVGGYKQDQRAYGCVTNASVWWLLVYTHRLKGNDTLGAKRIEVKVNYGGECTKALTKLVGYLLPFWSRAIDDTPVRREEK